MSTVGTQRSVQRYAAFVKVLLPKLRTLRQDLALAEEGWRFHFALDFAELFSFAFPMSQSRANHLEPLPDEQRPETYAREQATLSFIFARVDDEVLIPSKKLILLPPYIRELHGALYMVKHDLINLWALSGMLQGISRRTLGVGRFEGTPVGEAVRRYAEHGPPVPPEDLQVIESFVYENYRDLLSLAVAPSLGGTLDVLDELQSTEVIVAIGRYFKGVCDRDQLRSLELDRILADGVADEKSVRWLRKIDKIEWRMGLAIANHIDAVVCAILKMVNDRLVKQKGLMLLITHSRAMGMVVSNVKLPAGKVARVTGGVRDLDYFWAYYVSQGDSIAETIRRVDRLKQLFEHFLYVHEWLASEGDEPSALALGEARNILPRVRFELERLANASLGSGTDESVQRVVGMASSRVMPDFAAASRQVKQVLSVMSEHEVMMRLTRGRKLIEKATHELDEELIKIQRLSQS